MNTIGLLGGISPYATMAYYKKLLSRFPDHEIIIYSLVDKTIQRCLASDETELAHHLNKGINLLAKAKPQVVFLSCNSVHSVHAKLATSNAPWIPHIADAVSWYLHKTGVGKIGIISTAYTERSQIYNDRTQANNIEIIKPEPEKRELIHEIIYKELCGGYFTEQSMNFIKKMIAALIAQGAERVLLACTEFSPHISTLSNTNAPVIDSVEIHIEYH